MSARKSTGTNHDYLRAFAAGHSTKAIARRHGVTPTAVRASLRRAGLPSSLMAFAAWRADGNQVPQDQPPTLKRLTLDMRMIFSRCEEEGNCLLWVGCVNSNGIPYAHHDGKTRNLRRLVWSLAGNPEPPNGYLLTPACRNPACLKHLTAMSRKNLARKLAAEGVYSTPAANAARIAGRRAVSTRMDMDKAREIRASTLKAEDEAKRVGLSVSMVHLIRQKKCWAEASPHLPMNSVWALGLAA